MLEEPRAMLGKVWTLLFYKRKGWILVVVPCADGGETLLLTGKFTGRSCGTRLNLFLVSPRFWAVAKTSPHKCCLPLLALTAKLFADIFQICRSWLKVQSHPNQNFILFLLRKIIFFFRAISMRADIGCSLQSEKCLSTVTYSERTMPFKPWVNEKSTAYIW